MTRTQYNAMQHIAENAEHLRGEYLNIRPQTMAVLKRNEWIEPFGQGYIWTPKGCDAVAGI